jgi:hypothetical protein
MVGTHAAGTYQTHHDSLISLGRAGSPRSERPPQRTDSRGFQKIASLGFLHRIGS